MAARRVFTFGLLLVGLTAVAHAAEETFAEACEAQVRYQFEARLARAPEAEADRMVAGLCTCLEDGLAAKGADLSADIPIMLKIAEERPFDGETGPTPEMIALLERQTPVARPCMAAQR